MVDRYTKVVLTVIALCLMYLCVTTTLTVSQARAAARPRAGAIMDVNIVQLDGKSFNPGIGLLGALPVRIEK